MNGFFANSTPPQNPGAVPPAQRTDDPAGFLDTFGAAWNAETIRQDSFDYTRRIRTQLGLKMFSMLPADAKQRVADRNENGYEPSIDFAQIVAEEAAKQVGQDPTTWAGYPLNAAQLDAHIERQKKNQLTEAQAVLDRPGGGLAEFLGTGARDLIDPFNMVTMPLGGVGGGALKTILGEALIGGVSNLANLPTEQKIADEMGEARPTAMGRFAEGALFAGGLTGLLHGAARAWQYRQDRRAMTRAGTPDGMNPADHEADVTATRDRLSGQQNPNQAIFDQKGRVATGVPAMSDFDFSIAGNASPKTNRIGYVYGKLLSKGYSPEDAAAFVGNFMVESGPALHPGAVGDNGNALGIAQWNGPRKRDLEEFARKRGTDPTDLDTQIDFLDFELNNPKGEAAAWAAIRRATTVEEKAALVSDLFERPGIPRRESRVGYAAALHEQFNSGRIPKWEGGAADLSSEVPRFTTSRGYTGDGQISTPSGRRIDVKYEVIDASLLKRASGDLQPRDRSRAASDAWTKQTAARLDPAQLMPSPNAATGTPIIGPNNMIESGNGRFGAIEHAYGHFPDRAGAYRQAIEDITGAPIPPGIDRPVLVARRQTDLSPADLRSFTVDAQDAGVMRLSALEKAQVSARSLTPDLMARFDPATDMFAPENGHVVRAMFDALPASEHNAMTDGAGTLSGEGRNVIRQALFARAWPSADMIGRFIEGDPGELKSLMDALDKSAPHWAALRAEIEAGRVRADADISPFVLEAMRLIAVARDSAIRDGHPVAKMVAELMDTPDLMNGALSPVTFDLLTRKFWKNGRAASEAEITDFLTRYATEARKAATTEASLFDAPTTSAILRRIDPEVFGKLPDDIGAPRPIALRGQTAENGPPMADDAFAKGADSPEAKAGDGAALEGLGKSDPVVPPAAPSFEMEAGSDPEFYVKNLALAQPYHDVDGMYRHAEAAQRDLVAEGERIAADLGVEFKDPGLKDRADAVEKIVRKGYNSPLHLTDISRAGFVVPAAERAEDVVARLRERFDFVDEGWVRKPDSNYIDRKIIIRHSDGMLSEVQIWTPEMFRAKTAETEAYKRARSLDPESPEARAIFEQSARAYSAASARDNIDVTRLIPADGSIEPKLLAKRAENSSAVLPAASADRATSRPSTFTQSEPGSRIDTARKPEPGAVASSAGLPSQERKRISGVIGENPSFEDILNVGSNRPPVNTGAPAQEPADYEFTRAIADAKAGVGDMTLTLAEGVEVRATDLLDEVEQDHGLSEYLKWCNPGGQA